MTLTSYSLWSSRGIRFMPMIFAIGIVLPITPIVTRTTTNL
jgi:hypothetical protein